MVENLFTWDMLGTYAGAVATVSVITQLIKGVPFLIKIPTQIVSYVIALVVMMCASAFTTGLTANIAVLTVFNAAVVSFAANGAYAAAVKMTGGERAE